MEIKFICFALFALLNLICLTKVKMLQISKPAYIRMNFTNTENIIKNIDRLVVESTH